MSASGHPRPKITPFQASHYLARRLEALGLEPYQSMNGRYLVLMQDAPGEIFDLGRPLKGSRFFSKNSIRKDRKMIAEFEEFALEDGLQKCYYWGIGLPCAKTSCQGLEEALKSFNAKINQEFSLLRSKHGFELLLLAIHVRYDPFSQLSDLHSHFICRVKRDEDLDAVKDHLRRKFSKHHFPHDPIKSAGACATYMHSRIFDNQEMLIWPDEALVAAWKATEQRFRFSRAAGSFAEWRAVRNAANDNPEARADKERIKSNRRETADRRKLVQSTDKFLGKVMATVRGTKVFALLFENAGTSDPRNFAGAKPAPTNYPSATGVATQNRQNWIRRTLKMVVDRIRGLRATSRERGVYQAKNIPEAVPSYSSHQGGQSPLKGHGILNFCRLLIDSVISKTRSRR